MAGSSVEGASLMGACESAANLSPKSVFIRIVSVFDAECLKWCFFYLFIPQVCRRLD